MFPRIFFRRENIFLGTSSRIIGTPKRKDFHPKKNVGDGEKFFRLSRDNDNISSLNNRYRGAFCLRCFLGEEYLQQISVDGETYFQDFRIFHAKDQRNARRSKGPRKSVMAFKNSKTSEQFQVFGQISNSRAKLKNRNLAATSGGVANFRNKIQIFEANFKFRKRTIATFLEKVLCANKVRGDTSLVFRCKKEEFLTPGDFLGGMSSP